MFVALGERSGVAGGGSRGLYRFDINPLSSTYGKPEGVRQIRSPEIDAAPYGLYDLAVAGDGRFLVATAPKRRYELFDLADKTPGDLLVIDLTTVSTKPGSPPPAVSKVENFDGMTPLYIESTSDPKKLIFSNQRNFSRGVSILTLETDAKTGKLSKAIVTKQPRLVADDSYTYNTFWQVIDQAAGVVVTPDLKYAFVADFNLQRYKETAGRTVDDILFMEAKRVGAKIGVIKDPFGTPQFLGATMPIEDGWFDDISITPDGKNLLVGLTKVGGTSGLMIYDIEALIRHAEADSLAGTSGRLPIDGEGIPGRANREVPTRVGYGWVYGIESQNAASIRITGVGGIDPDKYNDPTKAILPTIKWEVEDPGSGVQNGEGESELYISVFDREEGLFPGSYGDRFGQQGNTQSLPGDLYYALPQVDGDSSRRDSHIGRVLTVKVTSNEYSNGKLYFEYALPPAYALTASQDYYVGVRYRFASGDTMDDVYQITTPTLTTPGRFPAVTLLLHGFQPPIAKGSAVETTMYTTAKNMAERTDGGLFIFDRLSGQWKADSNFGHYPEPKDCQAAGKPIFLVGDWYSESGISTTGFAEAAADAIYASLVKLNSDTQGGLKDVPLHIIGHSRGTVVSSEIAQRVGLFEGQFFKPSDLQLTLLDVHDFNQPSLNLLKLKNDDFADPDVAAWSNVNFVDNYYERLADETATTLFNIGDVSLNPNGRSLWKANAQPETSGLYRATKSPNARLSGANIDRSLDVLPGFLGADILTAGPHGRVQDWYAGTAVLNVPTVDGTDKEVPIWRHFTASVTYKDLFGGLNWNPWYVSRQGDTPLTGTTEELKANLKRSVSFEGVGEGWFYSVLGGGYSFRPTKFTGTRASLTDDQSERPTKGDVGLQVYGGTFEESVNPFDGRYLQTYDLPGWSIDNGNSYDNSSNPSPIQSPDARPSRAQFLDLRLHLSATTFESRLGDVLQNFKSQAGKDLISELYATLTYFVAPVLDTALDANAKAIRDEIDQWSLKRDLVTAAIPFALVGTSTSVKLNVALSEAQMKLVEKGITSQYLSGLVDRIRALAGGTNSQVRSSIMAATGIDLGSTSNLVSSMQKQYINGDQDLAYSLAARNEYTLVHNRMVIPSVATELVFDLAIAKQAQDPNSVLKIFWLGMDGASKGAGDPSPWTINLQSLANQNYVEQRLPSISSWLSEHPEGRLQFVVDVGDDDKATGLDVRLDNIRFVAIPLPLLVTTSGDAQPLGLSAVDAAPVLATAKLLWVAAGADPELLNGITLSFDDIDGNAVAMTQESTITLDPTAAGHGWFVDGTPDISEEFTASADTGNFVAGADSAATGKVDLLTTLIHEIGHALGLPHAGDASDLMSATLQPGERRLVSVEDIAALRTRNGLPQTQDTQTDLGTAVRITPLHLASQGAVAIPQYEVAANPQLQNEAFDGGTGWDTTGDVVFENGAAVLAESASAQTRLNQVFVLGEHDRFLSFTLDGHGLGDQAAGPDDAFEVALIDANTGAMLMGGTGLSRNDAFLNVQANSNERKAVGVSRIQNVDGSRTYLVDLAGIAAGTVVNLSFDLIGFGKGLEAANSQISVRDLRLGVPQTTDDTATLAEDTQADIDALGNDLNARQPGFSPTLVAGPANGEVTINTDGSFHYTPSRDWYGEDRFTYKLSDGVVDSNLATVTLTVTPVNDAPVIAPRTVQLDEDTQLVVDLREGASDVDGDTLTITITGQPQHGTLTQDAGGTWTYAPNANWNGTDVIDYLVGDGQASTATQLTFVVSAINDAPTLADQAFVTAEDTILAGNLLATAADVEGDSLTVTLVAGPANGTLALDADGGFVYTPNINFNGSDAFTYRVNDGELDSGLATVALTVMPVNDAPVIAPRTVTLDEDTQFVIDLLNGATDVDGDALAVLITAQPQHGTLMPNTGGTFTYVPDADWNGSDVVEYVVTDGQASTATQLTFVVNAINDAPTLSDQTLVTDEDIAFAGNLLATAADIEGDALSATLVAGPAHGALALTIDGGFTYTPDADFNGSDAFTYRVNDSEH
ncbi:MAG: Ig-like domain-containing protein, partial [Sulfuritalea sp.]|nr:Ig-like domain-containing protein [Sulfuritalea sp.]